MGVKSLVDALAKRTKVKIATQIHQNVFFGLIQCNESSDWKPTLHCVSQVDSNFHKNDGSISMNR